MGKVRAYAPAQRNRAVRRTDEPNERDRAREEAHRERVREEEHRERGRGERPFEPEDARRTFWPLPFGAWPPFAGRREDEADETAYPDESAYEEDESWWDEGLITLLIVGGVVLFLFPEPATSGLGLILLTFGILAWLFDWMT